MSRLVYPLYALAVAVQLIIHYPGLPDRIASHYDLAGNPNDWMSKQGLVAFYLGISVFVLGVFALVPVLVRKLPTSLINIPNREYWLAPERKAATIVVFTKHMDIFALGTGALLVAVFEMTFLANQSTDGKLTSPLWLLAAYGAFTVGWIVALTRRFRMPK